VGIFLEHKIGGVPVVESDASGCRRQRLVGIVTEVDVFRLIQRLWEAEAV
jgi:CBS domain-containing protein